MSENKSKKRTDFFPKVFSVIAAVILWFYVIDVRTTTEEITVYGVPIVVTNFSQADGMDIVSGKDFTVDVLVRGKKNDVSQISIQDIYASVDMNGITSAGTHKMDVDVVCLKKGVTIVNKTVSQINVNVDKNMSKTFPIEPIILYTIEEDVYEIGNPSLSVGSVSVTGPERVVESVDKVTVEMNVGKIENSITFNGKIKLYDKNNKIIESPYLKLGENFVKVEVPVTKKEIKTVVPVFYNTEYDYEYVAVPSQVYVKGSVNSVESIRNVSTEPITETVPMLVVKRLDLPSDVIAYDEDGNVIDTVRIEIVSAIDLNAVEESQIENIEPNIDSVEEISDGSMIEYENE